MMARNEPYRAPVTAQDKNRAERSRVTMLERAKTCKLALLGQLSVQRSAFLSGDPGDSHLLDQRQDLRAALQTKDLYLRPPDLLKTLNLIGRFR